MKQSPEVQALLEAAALAEELIPYHELEEYAERRRRMENKNWDNVTINNAKGLHTSDGGALKVEVDGDTCWIPMKLIDEDSECYKKGTEGTLIIPMWLAEEKGLA